MFAIFPSKVRDKRHRSQCREADPSVGRQT